MPCRRDVVWTNFASVTPCHLFIINLIWSQNSCHTLASCSSPQVLNFGKYHTITLGLQWRKAFLNFHKDTEGFCSSHCFKLLQVLDIKGLRMTPTQFVKCTLRVKHFLKFYQKWAFSYRPRVKKDTAFCWVKSSSICKLKNKILLVLAFQQGSEILDSGATYFSSFQLFLIKKPPKTNNTPPQHKTQSDFSDYNRV